MRRAVAFGRASETEGTDEGTRRRNGSSVRTRAFGRIRRAFTTTTIASSWHWLIWF